MKKTIRTDILSFEDLIKNGLLYVDKTKHVYKLVQHPLKNYVTIFRPNGFGKSLMCSTLKCLFEGKRELFKGLYIDTTDYDFEKYPVLFFDFAKLDTDSYKSFHDSFTSTIQDQAKINGVDLDVKEPSSMLNHFLWDIERKIVIIIDNFDVPLAKTLDNTELLTRIQGCFNAFFQIIKNSDRSIRFFFMTGETKYTPNSIFSSFNNCTDISMYPDYADMYGYTEKELEDNFSDYIDDYLKDENREYKTREEFLCAIREYYGGYRFSDDIDAKVFNPVSVESFFNNTCCFDIYWRDTIISKLALKFGKDLCSFTFDEKEENRIGTDVIRSFNISEFAEKNIWKCKAMALLYYSGYLTISYGNYDVFALAIPNREMRTVLTKSRGSC